ncbi:MULTISPECIES: hypothetical protein [Terrimonas]|uniref:hypothetical protein n=1 Tax=Terrimonas TaxID=296051 RepID=UPI0023EBC9C5|nr:hypothetical protein [Terrimonas sp. H1YJ31]
MIKLKFILPLVAVLLTAGIIIGFSSFSGDKEKKEQRPTEYFWFAVDYSVPEGRVPSGASPVFSGNKLTQADAQANDGCADVNQKHCLRGFTSMPSLPTTSYDASTPKPQ